LLFLPGQHGFGVEKGKGDYLAQDSKNGFRHVKKGKEPFKNLEKIGIRGEEREKI